MAGIAQNPDMTHTVPHDGSATPARVLLVEDEKNAFDRCAQIVNEHPRLTLAAGAYSYDEAAKHIRDDQEGFDLLLTDLQLGDGDGADLIREWRTGEREDAGSDVQAKRTPKRAMVITVFGDVTSVMRAVEAGADGYLLKGGSDFEMIQSISTVLDGGAPISAAVAGHLLKRVRKEAKQVPAIDPVNALTEREVEVLHDLARGRSYKEVARNMDISPYTVGDHVKTIYRKLAVTSRGEAVYKAIKDGLVDLS